METNFDQRRLVVVSGPSGCGKDTIVQELMRRDSSVGLSVSCTTRAPRGHEVDGVDYYFLSREEFESRIRNNELLEYAEYAGNYYGTPMRELEKQLSDGRTVVLVIEVVGAQNVKRNYPDSLLVFIVPPSLEELEKRLIIRNTESEEDLAKRLEIAAQELLQRDNYDVVLENNVVEECVIALEKAIKDWQNK